jgi:curved DNA-binding protein CbpA
VLSHRIAGCRSPVAACCHHRGLATASAVEGLTVAQLYDSLQLPRGASKGEVKARYFQLAKTLHPDNPGGSKAKFGRATDIYQRLVRIAPADDFMTSGHRRGTDQKRPRAAAPHGSETNLRPRKPVDRGRSSSGYDHSSSQHQGSSVQQEVAARLAFARRDAEARAASARAEAAEKVAAGVEAAVNSIRQASTHAQRVVDRARHDVSETSDAAEEKMVSYTVCSACSGPRPMRSWCMRTIRKYDAETVLSDHQFSSVFSVFFFYAGQDTPGNCS